MSARRRKRRPRSCAASPTCRPTKGSGIRWEGRGRSRKLLVRLGRELGVQYIAGGARPVDRLGRKAGHRRHARDRRIAQGRDGRLQFRLRPDLPGAAAGCSGEAVPVKSGSSRRPAPAWSPTSDCSEVRAHSASATSCLQPRSACGVPADLPAGGTGRRPDLHSLCPVASRGDTVAPGTASSSPTSWSTPFPPPEASRLDEDAAGLHTGRHHPEAQDDRRDGRHRRADRGRASPDAAGDQRPLPRPERSDLRSGQPRSLHGRLQAGQPCEGTPWPVPRRRFGPIPDQGMPMVLMSGGSPPTRSTRTCSTPPRARPRIAGRTPPPSGPMRQHVVPCFSSQVPAVR